MVAANPRQGREAAHARHVEVKEQQVGVGVLLDDGLQRVETVRLDDTGARHGIADGVDQCLTKQWMIVCNDECACGRQRSVLPDAKITANGVPNLPAY